jgi:hypothetical protein
VGRHPVTHQFHAAIISKRGLRVVLWKGPATGATREIALTRLVAQVEELGMDQMWWINTEYLLDGESDGEPGGDGDGDGSSAGNDQQHSKKRKNGNEASGKSVLKKQKSYKPRTGGGGNGSIAAGAVEEAVVPKRPRKSTGIRVKRRRLDHPNTAHVVTGKKLQGTDTVGPDIDNDTAMAKTPAKANSTSWISTTVETHSSTHDIQGVGGDSAIVGTDTPTKGWTGRFGFW